jgi:hypothetical protein
MSILKWKKEPNGRKTLFIITNPVSIVLCVLVFSMIVLFPLVGFLRSLLQ